MLSTGAAPPAVQLAIMLLLCLVPTLALLGLFRSLVRLRNDEATGESGVRCRHCGAPNPDGARYCGACIRRL